MLAFFYENSLLGTMFESFSKTIEARKTFFYDAWRCFFAGMIEAGLNSGFVLLIAIRAFHANKLQKSVLAAAWFAGYFITPITFALASRLRKVRATDICKGYMLSVAVLLVMAIFACKFDLFLTLVVLATILFKQPVPLMSDTYGRNYSLKERGGRLACVLMVLPLSTILFSPLSGHILDTNIQNYKWLLLIIALAAVGSAFAFHKIPSQPLPDQKGASIFQNFEIIWKDRFFFMMLLWWTLSGIANQMTRPLRAEYLVNPIYGINASNLFETFVCMTLPFAFRILTSLGWGRLFDTSRVVTVKLWVNLFLILGFLFFFNFRHPGIISLSAIFMGIGFGGGEVVWCLWITKIAPKEKFGLYMSANTAVVGLRGFFSPFLGYGLLNYLTLQQISWLATFLVILSSVGLWSLRNHPRFLMDYNNS